MRILDQKIDRGSLHSPLEIFTKSAVRGSLHSPFKNWTDSAVSGSLHFPLKIRTKSAIRWSQHGCLPPFLKIRTQSVVRGPLYYPWKTWIKSAVRGSLRSPFQNLTKSCRLQVLVISLKYTIKDENIKLITWVSERYKKGHCKFTSTRNKNLIYI